MPEGETATPDQAAAATSRRLEVVFLATFGLFGIRRGFVPIYDNGTFTHLRTGIDMANTGAIPRHDPYTFTALGHPWVVQSWLPEWTYGWAYRLGGYRLFIVEQGVLMAVLAVLIGLLARTGRPWRTVVAGAIAIGVGAPYWEQRPLVFGLIAMALLVLIVEHHWSPWWVVPVVWIWVNSHGSFPLAILWLAARAVGEYLDHRALSKATIRYGLAFAGGLVVSLANPLGYRLLTFPFTAATKREALQIVIEWKSPDFQVFPVIVSLVALAVALVVIARRTLSWTDALPAVGFVALGLLVQRNLPVAAIVLAPALGRALQPTADAVGGRRPDRELQAMFAGMLAIALLVTGCVLTINVYRRPPLYLAKYPIAAVDFLVGTGRREPSHRMATSDRVGNYLEAKFGTQARAFMDDRYDMFPLEVVRAYRSLWEAKPDALRVLDRWRIDVVLWDKNWPLATVLRTSGNWRSVYRDRRWEVFERA